MMSPLLIVLSVLVVFIFYRLFQLFGQKNVGLSIKIVRSPEELKEILEQNKKDKEDETVAEHKEILRPQWSMLKQLDPAISEQKILSHFIDLFKRVNYTFASGQKMSEVQDFVSKDVKNALESALEERGIHKYMQRFEGEPKCSIKEIHINGKMCSIESELKSTQVVQIQDENGDILDNPNGIAEDITDFWIFQRDYTNPASNWVVMQMS